MNYSKAAAVVAGSMIALGAASPAVAAPQALGPEALKGVRPHSAASALSDNGLGKVTGKVGDALEKDEAAKGVTKVLGATGSAAKKGTANLGGLPVGRGLPVGG